MSKLSLLRFTKSMAKLNDEPGEKDKETNKQQVPKSVSSFSLSASASPPTNTPSATAQAPHHPTIIVPNSANAPGVDSPSSSGKKSAPRGDPRRMLHREQASRNLPIRQIKQEGAPSPTATAARGNKDTVTVWDWYRAMDEQAEKERAMFGTVRGTLRGKTLRPTKSSRRVNENFEDFMRMAQQAEEHNHSMLKSKSMSVVENSSEPVRSVTRETSMMSLGTKKAEEPKPEDSVMDKQFAPDDESLKVFLHVWNQLDTLEEQLAVHEELAEAEEKMQMSQEVPAVASPRGNGASPRTNGASPRSATSPTKEVSPRTVTTPAEPATPTPEPTKAEPTPAPTTSAEPAPATPTKVEQPTAALVSPRKPDDSVSPALPAGYKGPHYKSPVTQDFVEALLQYCASEGLSATVPYAYVKQVVLDAMEVFRTEPTILDIPLSNPKDKAVVIGDIHGQFPDLITILRDTGLPGANQTLIFNGDFVDRGPAGVEVLLSLYVMKLCWPNNIFIHRGNHELESINRKYNFADQVIKKYDEELFTLIQDSFAY